MGNLAAMTKAQEEEDKKLIRRNPAMERIYAEKAKLAAEKEEEEATSFVHLNTVSKRYFTVILGFHPEA